MYPLPDFTREIIGGSLGGLALLLLITAVLYKVKQCRITQCTIQELLPTSNVFKNLALNSQVGFFKSKYKDMIGDTGEEAENPEAGDQAPPLQT